MAHFIIKLGPNGEREVEAFGFRQDGNTPESDCRKETHFMEEVLGTVGDVKAKTDWTIRNGEQSRRTKVRFGIDTTKLCG